MKKIIIIILITMIMICGCSSNKTALTGSEFKNKVTELKYDVIDSLSDYAYAKSAYKLFDNNYSVIFIETNKFADAEGIYLDEVTNLERNISKKVKKNTNSSKNFSSYEVEEEDNYYYLILVDNTVLMAESNKDSKEEIKTLINKIGY